MGRQSVDVPIPRSCAMCATIDHVTGRADMTEADIQSLILIYLTSLPDTYAQRQNTGAAHDGRRLVRYGVPGQADILCCMKGRFIEVEVKTKTGRQSEAQKQRERNITRASGIYILARSVEDVQNRLMEEGLV